MDLGQHQDGQLLKAVLMVQSQVPVDIAVGAEQGVFQVFGIGPLFFSGRSLIQIKDGFTSMG